jgi:ATP-dependent Lon protease
VLPVGGIREKIMAAARAGIRTVVLPEKCERAVHSLEADVLEGLDIRLVHGLDDVVELALL